MTEPNPQAIAARERLEKLSHWLDRGLRVPGTSWRVGIESLLGLVPVVGDLGGLALSLWTLREAHQAGAPKPLLWRMAANCALDAGAGSLPVLGDLFDFFYQANRRNLELLREHLDVRLPTPKRSPWRWVVLAVAVGLSAAAWFWWRQAA